MNETTDSEIVVADNETSEEIEESSTIGAIVATASGVVDWIGLSYLMKKLIAKRVEKMIAESLNVEATTKTSRTTKSLGS